MKRGEAALMMQRSQGTLVNFCPSHQKLFALDYEKKKENVLLSQSQTLCLIQLCLFISLGEGAGVKKMTTWQFCFQ